MTSSTPTCPTCGRRWSERRGPNQTEIRGTETNIFTPVCLDKGHDAADLAAPLLGDMRRVLERIKMWADTAPVGCDWIQNAHAVKAAAALLARLDAAEVER